MDQNQLLALANQFAQAFPWDTLMNAGLVSPLLLGYKHWLQIEGDKTYTFGPFKLKGEMIMLGFVTVFSMGAPFIWAAIQGTNESLSLLFLKGFVTGFMTQPVYYLLIKPALRWNAAQIEKEVAKRMAAVIVPPAAAPSNAQTGGTTPTQFK